MSNASFNRIHQVSTDPSSGADVLASRLVVAKGTVNIAGLAVGTVNVAGDAAQLPDGAVVIHASLTPKGLVGAGGTATHQLGLAATSGGAITGSLVAADTSTNLAGAAGAAAANVRTDGQQWLVVTTAVAASGHTAGQLDATVVYMLA